MTSRAMTSVVVLAALVAGPAGCSLGKNVPTRYFVLTPVAAAGPGRTGMAPRDVTVGVGPVRLPAYLDRSQIVTRTARDEVEISDLDQWAEPLPDAVARIITENLGALAGTDRVVVLPWRGIGPVQYRVALDVSRFDGAMGGDVVLQGRWRLLDGRGRELTLRTLAFTERAAGRDYGALAAAMSRLLATASRDMAAEIAQQVASAAPR
jgi:uncharacterized lipoprotein YmbA